MLAADLLMYLPSYVLPVIPSTDFRRLAEWLAHMYQYTRQLGLVLPLEDLNLVNKHIA
jgi:hypothetical protein